jgi:predicted nucleic acid-binding protein
VVIQSSLLRRHERVGIDTSLFIYHFEAQSTFSSAAARALDLLTSGRASGITSVLTLTELLVRPLQLNRPGLASRYEARIRAIPNLSVVDVDDDVARLAARLRSRHQVRTADAVHVASALQHDATAFITNDVRLRRIDELEIVLLSEFGE